MGAKHEYDLTPEATHLIVGDYNTPKYQFVARERPDVRAMTIEWVEAIRELWINDKAIDMEALEKEYTLPTFHSLKFSMTGCDDPTERLEIAEKVKAHGAIYEGDLTKQITHLISFRTEGAKYKAAKTWGLRIVSPEWLSDSLERGMILDEKLYDPSLPPLERGKGAWDKTKPRTSLGKRLRTDIAEGAKRKLRRTASSKLNSQNGNLWNDIIGSGMPQVSRSGVWENDQETQPRKGAVESRENSSSTESTVENPPLPKGIFSGCRFFLHGFPPTKVEILRGHLLPADGEVSSTIEELVGSATPSNRLFRIVPHNLQVSEHPQLPDSNIPIQTVTSWWVERCLHHKLFLGPSEHIIGRPFPVFPIEGSSALSISTSAFSGIDLLHVTRAIKLIGAAYSEDMTPNSSVVVCRTFTALRKDKLKSAQEWMVPIVTAEWLWDSIKASEILSMIPYRCRSQKRHDSLPSTSRTVAAETISKPERSKSEIIKVPSISTSSQAPKRVTNHHETRKSLPMDLDAFESAPKPYEATTTLSTGSQASKAAIKVPKSAWLDDNAFSNDDPVLKEEIGTDDTPPFTAASKTATSNTDTQDPSSCKTAPLSERSANSPTKTVSTAPAPSDHPAPKPPREDMSSTISDLLAKTRNAAVQPAQKEQPEGRKRGGHRILGRVTSNMSTVSTAHSTATSVDSTATHGNPVERLRDSTGSLAGQTANERMQMLMEGDKYTGKDVDSQPPPTQLQYEDPDSTEAREMVMAKMKGEKVEKKRGRPLKKSATMGDFNIKPRAMRKTGRDKGRGMGR